MTPLFDDDNLDAAVARGDDLPEFSTDIGVGHRLLEAVQVQAVPIPDIDHVEQTIFGGPAEPHPGNCQAAAVASVLRVPLDTVPHFCTYAGPGGWWDAQRRWTRLEHALDWAIVRTIELVGSGVLGIAGVRSLYRPVQHAVVVVERDGLWRCVHDPRPTADYLGWVVDPEHDAVELLVEPYDPAPLCAVPT